MADSSFEEQPAEGDAAGFGGSSGWDVTTADFVVATPPSTLAPPEVTSGTQVITTLSATSSISQTLNQTYAAGTVVFTAAVARSELTSETSVLSLEFRDASDAVLSSVLVPRQSTPANGAFVDMATELTLSSSSSAIGQPVRIALAYSGGGVGVAVDQIRVCRM